MGWSLSMALALFSFFFFFLAEEKFMLVGLMGLMLWFWIDYGQGGKDIFKEPFHFKTSLLKTIMPHWVLQNLLVGADHLLHPRPVLVDLKSWDDSHILRPCDQRALIYVDLSNKKKPKIKHKEDDKWKGVKNFYRYYGLTLRKLADGYRLHRASTKGEIWVHCWFDAAVK